ncbi:unnamed protein product [Macrosiphum euphorbiae]|uniref:Uncharacterized protein n=1 Tax=Macrosiphum euphorbiae TaxID=13131 RepID=A0AAV0WJ34_9HEMI|nr:unnamed protein product [Macrosiphum euphorbiae]
MANDEMGIFRLSKWAFHTLPNFQRLKYYKLNVPCMSLLKIVKLNTEGGHFDPNADRQSMFDKVKSISNHKFEYICTTAVGNDHIDCLQFAHKIGCKWDKFTSARAEGTSSECLMYLQPNGCEWDQSTCT